MAAQVKDIEGKFLFVPTYVKLEFNFLVHLVLDFLSVNIVGYPWFFFLS